MAKATEEKKPAENVQEAIKLLEAIITGGLPPSRDQLDQVLNTLKS